MIPATMEFTATHASKVVTDHHVVQSSGFLKGCKFFKGTYVSPVSAWHRVITEHMWSISFIH